jgi:hypothetical protein
VLAAHPEATVHGRGRNWLRHRIADAPDGRARYVLDAAIGPLHYGAALDQEIDTAWEADAGVWQHRMVRAEFEARAKALFNGAPLLEYRIGSDWVTLQPRQLDWTNDRGDIQVAGNVQNISAAQSDDRLVWVGAYGVGRDFEWQVQTARIVKRVILQSYGDLPAPSSQILTGGNPVLRPQFQFAYSDTLTAYVDGQSWTGGNRPTLDTAQPIEFRDAGGTVVCAFSAAHILDASDIGESEIPGLVTRVQKAGNNLLVEVRVPQGWLEAAAYPVVIDPTIDKTVAASSDDANELAGSMNTTRADSNIIDATNEYFGARWSVSDAPIPAGATINVCYVTINYNSGSLDEPNHTMRFEELAAPVTFTTTANDISSRAMTTASVVWSSTDLGAPGDFNSPSLVTPLQEVVDSQGQLSAIVWIIQGSATATRDFECTTYDGSTTLAPRLHIEYSSGAINLAATLTAASLTTAANVLNVARAMAAAAAGVSATPATNALSVARAMAAQSAAASSTPDTAILLSVIYVAAALAAQSATPDAGALNVLRGMLAMLEAGSATPDTSALNVARAMAAAALGQGATPDTAALTVARAMAAALQAQTATPDATFSVARAVLAALNAQSVTPDTAALTISGLIDLAAVLTAASATPGTSALIVARSLTAALAAGGNTPDVAVLAAARQFTAVLVGASTAPDMVGLLRALPAAATIGSQTAAPDTAALNVSRSIAAATTAGGLTPDTAALDVLRSMMAALAAQTATPAATLGVTRTMLAALVAQTATPSATLSVLLAMLAAIEAQSVTPDTVTLSVAGFIEFAAVVTAASATPGTAALTIERLFTAILAGASAAPDTVELLRSLVAAAAIQSQTAVADTTALSVLRNAAAVLNAQTLTPDAGIRIERALASVLQFESVTPDAVELFLKMITGLALVSALARKTGISAMARKPGVSATAKKPGVTVD